MQAFFISNIKEMNKMTKRIHAKLCPSCKRLISDDDTKCPFCGTRYPHFALKQFFVKLFNKDDLIFVLIMINVFMFSVSIGLDISRIGLDINPLNFLSPGNEALFWLGATGSIPINDYGHWWSIVTANYLHGGLLHIMMNMLALNQIGSLIVREFGAYRFWIIYTASGIFGFVLSWWMNVAFTIGASAAICGLIGAGCYFGKSQGGDYGNAVFRDISGWIIGLFLFGFLVDGINNWAHAGGLAGGIVFAFLLGYDIHSKFQGIHRILAGLCVAATILSLVWGIGFSVYVFLM
ncbi:MAG: Rhomboid family protein [Candidatus Magnetoglobus multicellularis str. Araruama]|uniref:Rhomboid family protein n=1 Tax=Candidatus Magnetoglobus multicellularis str. Araruama TaxID=890399 RepID=A0A1V1PGQ3_9BACT|nr:MAG: Rhomboid family protein [Candidatus Magnetoglobus multicellularis str. Araruama]